MFSTNKNRCLNEADFVISTTNQPVDLLALVVGITKFHL